MNAHSQCLASPSCCNCPAKLQTDWKKTEESNSWVRPRCPPSSESSLNIRTRSQAQLLNNVRRRCQTLFCDPSGFTNGQHPTRAPTTAKQTKKTSLQLPLETGPSHFVHLSWCEIQMHLINCRRVWQHGARRYAEPSPSGDRCFALAVVLALSAWAAMHPRTRCTQPHRRCWCRGD